MEFMRDFSQSSGGKGSCNQTSAMPAILKHGTASGMTINLAPERRPGW